ncbi:MAG: quinolinate synthase NadA [Candidatus Melainabacteria bacterium]|nr:quinolinate synthase NadA [Candidatus Melainabacteria bacterium]
MLTEVTTTSLINNNINGNGKLLLKRDVDALRSEIKNLAKEKNAVILAHIYQRLEVQDIADQVGDSLALSRFAANTNADIIVFCGVHFMAETAKLLNPKKTVLLPDLQSGCPMADMISVDDLRAFRAEHPGAPVVCYVNSSASVKAESDACCTSTNAVQVVKAFKEDEIIFVPDKGLAVWVQEQVPDKKIHIYDGFCPTHYQITPKDVFVMREKYPDAVVVAHPECDPEVWRLADFVGSTSQIYKFVTDYHKQQFIILSEQGLVARMQRDMQHKTIVTTFPLPLCPNMKYHKLETVLSGLKENKNKIEINSDIFESASQSIIRMFEITESNKTGNKNFWEGPKRQ